MKGPKGKAASGDDKGLVDNLLLRDLLPTGGEDDSARGEGRHSLNDAHYKVLTPDEDNTQTYICT